MLYTGTVESPLGKIVIAGNETGLCGVWFEGAKYFGSTLGDDCIEDANAPMIAETVDWLKRYFDGQKPDPAQLSLCLTGSAFRQAVWSRLLLIPYGKTITYGEIAASMAAESGSRVSAQAVGGAVAHNPISVIIPCHRVVGADGSLTGYAGGIDKKRWLLEHEKKESKA